eukprot:278176_1
MASITTGMIVCGVVFWTSFIICLLLLSRSIYDYCKKKRKIQSSRNRAIGLSLVSMFFFTVSLLLYAVHFIMFVALGRQIPALDQLNNACYLVAIFTALYVWIQRLNATFHKSAHGYSAKYIRNLRIFFWFTLAVGGLLFIQHIVVNILDVTRIVSVIGGALFCLLFISLFVTVLVSFIHKMKESVKLAEEVAHNTAHQTHCIGKKLIQLIVKFTILSVLCVGSTLGAIAFILACYFIDGSVPPWLFQLPLAIDDFCGFISLYCAWSNNKRVYKRLFGCVHSVIIKYRDESSIQTQTPDLASRDLALSVSVGSLGSDVQLSHAPAPVVSPSASPRDNV